MLAMLSGIENYKYLELLTHFLRLTHGFTVYNDKINKYPVPWRFTWVNREMFTNLTVYLGQQPDVH